MGIAVLGTGLSGILYSFLGWIGLLSGYGLVILLGSIEILPEILPKPWNRYFVFVYAALLFVWRGTKPNKKAKKSKSTKEKQKKAKPPVKQPAAQAGLLTSGMLSGYCYQLFYAPGEIRAYYIGGGLKGVHEHFAGCFWMCPTGCFQSLL